MATMGFRWSGIGGAPQVKEYYSDGGNDFAIGDLVTLASGKVTIITADSKDIFGVALKAAGTSTTVKIPVQIITPDSIWIAEADTTTTAAYQGEDYGLNISTGLMSVDIGDTTTTTVRIEQLDSRDGAAALGRVYVRFKAAVLDEDV